MTPKSPKRGGAKRAREKDFTTGVHMTIWQAVPEEGSIFDALQQEQLEDMQHKYSQIDTRLKRLEKRLNAMEDIEHSYSSMLQTLKLILGKR